MSAVASMGMMLIFLRGHFDSVAFSPNGSKIVESDDRSIRVWDASTSVMLILLQGHFDFVAFSPDGSKIIRSDDGSIQVWDADTGMMCR